MNQQLTKMFANILPVAEALFLGWSFFVWLRREMTRKKAKPSILDSSSTEASDPYGEMTSAG